MADSIGNSPEIEIWDLAKSEKYLSKPRESDNKYRRGVLGCFTGDRNYPGAALMTTAAALATGVGMVRYLGSKRLRKDVIQFRPSVVGSSGPVDVLLIGSGVKSNFLNRQKMKKLISKKVPKVLDASAIQFSKSSRSITVITPHAGELSRLIGVKSSDIESNPVKYAQIAAELLRTTVLLKGNQTVVANGKRIIQLPAASTWLATAGTGDVLAGILGALIAINHEIITQDSLIELSATASLLHSLAAMSASPGPIDIETLIKEIPIVLSKM